ncbi:MAG: ABC transporter ATP-binding protein, partial [Oscillospiraceae bacterium]|nr:ABC transporter ATP-binding protein [Oscillospiraceae bacterium]
ETKEKKERPQRGSRAQQTARRQLTICEKEIAAQEQLLAELSAKLEENAADYEKYAVLYEEKEREEEKLMALMERWEELALEAGD